MNTSAKSKTKTINFQQMKEEMNKPFNNVHEKKLYAIHDKLRGCLGVMEFPNDQVAIRYFEELANSEKSLIHSKPEDFELKYCGYMNEETGELVSDVKTIKKAKDCIYE